MCLIIAAVPVERTDFQHGLSLLRTWSTACMHGRWVCFHVIVTAARLCACACACCTRVCACTRLRVCVCVCVCVCVRAHALAENSGARQFRHASRCTRQLRANERTLTASEKLWQRGCWSTLNPTSRQPRGRRPLDTALPTPPSTPMCHPAPC